MVITHFQIPWEMWMAGIFGYYVILRFLLKYIWKRRHTVVANIARALDLMARDDPPMACCTGCKNQPLVLTFARAGYEFHCTNCHSWFGWLDPNPITSTAELDARQKTLQDEYKERPCH